MSESVERTHCPTDELHPTMHDSSQEWERMCAPFSTVQRFILTPSSRTTPAPIVTLGPMVQFLPITAVGSFGKKVHYKNSSGFFLIELLF